MSRHGLPFAISGRRHGHGHGIGEPHIRNLFRLWLMAQLEQFHGLCVLLIFMRHVYRAQMIDLLSLLYASNLRDFLHSTVTVGIYKSGVDNQIMCIRTYVAGLVGCMQ